MAFWHKNLFFISLGVLFAAVLKAQYRVDSLTAQCFATSFAMITLIRLINFGRLSLADLVDETHSPKNAIEVYNRLAKEKSFPVVEFDWSKFE